jgi:ATP-dependent DNA helicase 2 subunit 2
LSNAILRLGDVDTRYDEAIEIVVKTSKCTSIQRPKGFKKFALRQEPGDEAAMDVDEKPTATYVKLKTTTEYFVDKNKEDKDEEGDVKMEDEDYDLLDGPPQVEKKAEELTKVEKEELVRGYKYGTTYVPCPDGNFPRLPTTKGIDLCGFFYAKNVSLFHWLPILLSFASV